MVYKLFNGGSRSLMIQFEEFITPQVDSVFHKPPDPPSDVNFEDEVVNPNQNLFPIQIEWKNLEYTIEKGFFRKKKERILNMKGLGCVSPGEILAVMGPSGSGKSTFLNILYGRYNPNGGEILFNGSPPDYKQVRNSMGFVQQDDILNKHLTVQETLFFTAMLRISSDFSIKQKMDIVENTMRDLGIYHCRNRRIGGIGSRNVISGGERKRTCIASELLTSPSILFLDEPTSGLDSRTALRLVETLKKLADRRHTIILTIHQPRSSIFQIFDKVLLLSKGRIAYFGPTSNIMPYFKKFEKLSDYSDVQMYNPADFIIDLVTETEPKDRDTNELVLNEFEKEPLIVPPTCPEQYKMEKYNIPKYSTSIFNEIITIFVRATLSFFRDHSVFLMRLLQNILMAVLVGLVYLHTAVGQRTIQNNIGALFFILIQNGMAPLFATLNVFQSEKKVFIREYNAGSYRVLSYYLGKSFAELPSFMIFPIVFGAICYYIVGFNPAPDRFFTFLLILTLIAVTSHSLGLIISAMSNSLETATLISPFIVTLLILFSGFYLNVTSIPVYFIWVYYISYYRYGFEALAINEFTNKPLYCLDWELVNGVCPITNGNQVLQKYGFETNLWLDIGILFGMIILFRIIAFFCFYLITKFQK